MEILEPRGPSHGPALYWLRLEVLADDTVRFAFSNRLTPNSIPKVLEFAIDEQLSYDSPSCKFTDFAISTPSAGLEFLPVASDQDVLFFENFHELSLKGNTAAWRTAKVPDIRQVAILWDRHSVKTSCLQCHAENPNRFESCPEAWGGELNHRSIADPHVYQLLELFPALETLYLVVINPTAEYTSAENQPSEFEDILTWWRDVSSEEHDNADEYPGTVFAAAFSLGQALEKRTAVLYGVPRNTAS
ncbi:hypothetical protein B0J18DRAFT_470042 [Chaetomium sp. MPI-SDFR-AT-0129]|nr:hypothetical protein B0J18DRAFT_470042 [Chaetomium sp. MPI-SDFR-AT-0129]